MSNAILEILETADAGTIRALRRDPAFKEFVLDFERSKASVDIDFSNQSTFSLGGTDMPLVQVILIALSSLTISADYEDKDKSKSYIGDTPKVAGLLADAWVILKRVKAGKLAQEQEWSNTRVALAAYIESAI
jgi:hypothetical protein